MKLHVQCARGLQLGASLGLALAFAACGGDDASKMGPSMQPPAAAAPAGAAGDTATPSTAATAGTSAGSASSMTASTAGTKAPGNAMPTSPSTNMMPQMTPATGGTPAMMPMSMMAGAGAMAPMSMAGTGAMTPPANDDSPMPSPGCTGGTLKPGRTMGSIQSSGGNRSYIQYIPRMYDGMKPVPLVVDLHPFSVGASFAESSSGFRQLADGENYAYLAPQGIGNEWDSVGDMDEKFIRDLVNDVAKKGCIDLRRIYATGCSNGGAFSFLLMCTAEDIFAAVAPMCGTAFFNLETNCMLDRPVSLMLRIGRQDTLNCWEGEGMTLDAPNVMPGTKIPCAKTVQKILGEKNHCKGTPMKMDKCEFLGDCDEGTEIAICDEPTGHVVYQSSTAKDTWAFLKRFYKH